MNEAEKRCGCGCGVGVTDRQTYSSAACRNRAARARRKREKRDAEVADALATFEAQKAERPSGGSQVTYLPDDGDTPAVTPLAESPSSWFEMWEAEKAKRPVTAAETVATLEADQARDDRFLTQKFGGRRPLLSRNRESGRRLLAEHRETTQANADNFVHRLSQGIVDAGVLKEMYVLWLMLQDDGFFGWLDARIDANEEYFLADTEDELRSNFYD